MRTTTSAYRIVLLAMAFALVGGTLRAKSPLERLNPFSWVSSKSSEKPEPVPGPTASQKADLQISVGRSLEREGKLEQAIAIYSDALKKDNHLIEAYQRSAIVNDQLGNFEESDKLYRAGLKREPKNAELLCDRGYSFYLQNRHAEAEQTLREALAINPRLARAHNNLALVLAQNDRDEQALAEFAQGGCCEAEARVNLAFCMMARRDWTMARQELQRALSADPNSAAIKNGLAYLRAKAPTEVAQTAPTLPVAMPVVARASSAPVNPTPAIAAATMTPSATVTSYEVPQLPAGAMPPISVENATFSELLARAQASQMEQPVINRKDFVFEPASLGIAPAESASQASQAVPVQAGEPVADEQLDAASPQPKSELHIVERQKQTATVNR